MQKHYLCQKNITSQKERKLEFFFSITKEFITKLLIMKINSIQFEPRPPSYVTYVT